MTEQMMAGRILNHIPRAAYDQAKADGHDMTGVVPVDPLPVGALGEMNRRGSRNVAMSSTSNLKQEKNHENLHASRPVWLNGQQMG